MLLIVICLALILAIATVQIVQGIYGATVMAIISTFSAVIAFAFYENLGQLFLYNFQRPYADALGLLALFVVSLLVLRELADRFLGKENVLGMWANRIGGGILGLYTAMICAGILAVSIQMMPLDASIFGYKPYSDSLERQDSLAPFYPDRFVSGMFSKFSASGLKGERQYSVAHDDLMLELFCARNTAGKNGRVYCEQLKKGKEPPHITVNETYEPAPEQWKMIEGGNLMPDYPLLGANVPTRKIIVKADISIQARDEDNWMRLPATHFRLVTTGGKSYYPIGLLDPGSGTAGKFTAYWASTNEDNEIDVANLIYIPKTKVTNEAAKVFVVYIIPDNADEVALAARAAESGVKAAVEGEPDYILFRKLGLSKIGKITKSLPRP